MELTFWEWTALCFAAFAVGMGKGGLPGAGNFAIAVYALILPARMSVGVLLPVLLAGDLIATWLYRKDADWKLLRSLLPWAVIGILVGTFFFSRMDDRNVEVSIGLILLVMTAFHFSNLVLQKKLNRSMSVYGERTFKASTGIVGGFASMVANAAGPVAAIYLIYLKLPKLIFVGTLAWFFLFVNVFKLPFQFGLGNINNDSILISWIPALFAILGVIVARRIVRYIPQKLFEILIWIFIIGAGIQFIL